MSELPLCYDVFLDATQRSMKKSIMSGRFTLPIQKQWCLSTHILKAMCQQGPAQFLKEKVMGQIIVMNKTLPTVLLNVAH